jgi:hypothetical protein
MILAWFRWLLLFFVIVFSVVLDAQGGDMKRVFFFLLTSIVLVCLELILPLKLDLIRRNK